MWVQVVYLNALPELIHDANTGGQIQLRDVLSADSGMSPLEIWCNEAQERYVLGIAADQLAAFEAIARASDVPMPWSAIPGLVINYR